MKSFTKLFFIVITILIFFSGVTFRQQSFSVDITCDKDIYYTGDNGNISIALSNNGVEAITLAECEW